MFGATILVPIVLNTTVVFNVLSILVALVSSGLSTFIYLICTCGHSTVYLGSSFAFIAPVVADFAIAGKVSVFTSLMIVALLYVFIFLIIRVSGKACINLNNILVPFFLFFN